MVEPSTMNRKIGGCAKSEDLRENQEKIELFEVDIKQPGKDIK